MAAHVVMRSAKPPIDTPNETVRELQTKTHCHPLRDGKVEAISGTLVEVEARKVVDIWADTVARVEIRTVNDSLGQLESEEPIKTLSNALEETRRYTRKCRGLGTAQHTGQNSSRAEGRDNKRYTRGCGGRGTAQHNGQDSSRGEGQDNWRHDR